MKDKTLFNIGLLLLFISVGTVLVVNIFSKNSPKFFLFSSASDSRENCCHSTCRRYRQNSPDEKNCFQSCMKYGTKGNFNCE